MKTTFQYRFYPDTKQRRELNEWLRIARYWYNRQLGDRFDWWEMNRTSVNACPLVSSIAALRDRPNFYAQKKQLPVLKQDLVKVCHSGELLDFSRVDASVLQDVSRRVAKAFERFTVGDNSGHKSGKPRFKSVANFKTLTFSDGKAIKISRVRRNWMYLRLPKLGVVKVRMHRAIPEGFIIIPQNPAYSSMVLCYRDEIIFTDCAIREYWDEQESLRVDRDVNAAINLKRLGLDIFPRIKRRSGKLALVGAMAPSTTKEILHTLHRAVGSPHHNL